MRQVAFQWHHPSESVQLVCLTSHPSPLSQLYMSETPRMRTMRVVKVTITVTPMTTIVTPMTTTVTIMTMEIKIVTAAATPAVMRMQIMVTVMMATAQVIAPTVAKMAIESNKDVHPTKPAIINTMMRNISMLVTAIGRLPATKMKRPTILVVNLTA